MVSGSSGVPALGTASPDFSIIRAADGLVGTHFGYDANTGNGYIQQQRTDSATAYSLLLQPRGGNIGIGIASTPAEKLDIAGAVKIGTTANVCSATNEGSVRYDNTAKKFQGCNGTAWVDFTTVAGGGSCTITEARL